MVGPSDLLSQPAFSPWGEEPPPDLIRGARRADEGDTTSSDEASMIPLYQRGEGTRAARPFVVKWSPDRPAAPYPAPFVFVAFGFALVSNSSMILPATSMPVAFSTPSKPGEELTSITTGP